MSRVQLKNSLLHKESGISQVELKNWKHWDAEMLEITDKDFKTTKTIFVKTLQWTIMNTIKEITIQKDSSKKLNK